MKFVDLGYATINLEDIKLIFEPNSVPMRTLISTIKKADEEATQKNSMNANRKYLNLTFGAAANSYIELKDGRIIGTGYTLRALSKRIKEF